MTYYCKLHRGPDMQRNRCCTNIANVHTRQRRCRGRRTHRSHTKSKQNGKKRTKRTCRPQKVQEAASSFRSSVNKVCAPGRGFQVFTSALLLLCFLCECFFVISIMVFYCECRYDLRNALAVQLFRFKKFYIGFLFIYFSYFLGKKFKFFYSFV